MGDFLAFRTMMMPIFIQVLFWLGSGLALVVGLYNLTIGDFANGLGLILFGPLLIRIYCEFLILLFRMNETLTEIRNELRQNAPRKANPYTESV